MIYSIAEIPRLYTAIAQWGACLMYVSLLSLKFEKWKIAIASVFFLMVQSSFLVATGDVNLIFWVPCMCISILFMFGFIYMVTESSLLNAFYYCVHAFVLAEFVASFAHQLIWFFEDGKPIEKWIEFLLVLITYGTVLIIAYSISKKYLPKSVKIIISRKETIGAVIIAIAVFSISNIGFISDEIFLIGEYPGQIITVRTLVDLGGYAILFAHYILCCQSRYQKELEAVNSILENHYVQYEQSKESMELIGQMHHDLKHQLIALRYETEEEKRNQWLDMMEAEIDTYEVQNKTGNAVLDVILTGKKIQCKNNGISLTCVANGKLLEGIETRDICNIFGNALDNAIEHVKQIEVEEKRLIHVTVSEKQGFLLICIENYFEGMLSYEEGVPKTTKQDTNYHGYGLKSIKMIAKKYHGEVSIETSGNWFELAIILPIN